MNAEPSFLAAMILGIAYAALPGVINTECIRHGVTFGFWPATQIQIGALLGDAVWAVIALTGSALLLQHAAVGLVLGLAGAGFLFHLARIAFTSALRGSTLETAPARTGSSLMTGAVFSLANPAGLAFWTGIGGGLVGAGGNGLAIDRAAVFLLAFLIGAVAWGAGLSALVAWGRRFATPRVFQIIDGLSGLALGYFGIRLLWSTLQRYGRWLAFARPVLT